MQIVNLICTSLFPLELYGDGGAQPGVGGLRGLHHLHHQCPQHVLQQTTHGTPFSGHWLGRAQWKEAQVPGPYGVGKRKSLAPRGVDGKGSWPGQPKSVWKETCVVWFCLWVKRKESLEMAKAVLALGLTAKITQSSLCFWQTGEGAPFRKFWLWLDFSFFQTSEMWLCMKEHLSS